MEPNQNSSENAPRAILTVPVAIVLAAVIIAVSIVWIKRPAASTVSPTLTSPAAQGQTTLKPVTSSDHILGNPNAPIKIVEFSDPSCPYCKMFYPTMTEIMNTYGTSGEVAWIYRAFPLDKPDANGNILHPNAGHESQALECAATLGGNAKFWAYADRLYSITPSVTPATPTGLDQSQLPVIAAYVGLDVNQFNACLTSGKEAATVEAQYQDGLAAGVLGTPSSFILTSDGQQIPIQGAESFDQIKAIIDTLLSGTTASSTSQ